MDPYLEDPAVFPDLHDRLIYCLSEALNAVLPPPYFSGIASRVWVESSQRRVGPDVKVLRPDAPVNGGVKGSGGGGGVAVAQATATEPVLVRLEAEEARETFLEIHAEPGGERLVTTIEILSLTNKTPGSHGRELYLQKQQEMLASEVHLVEIDLLRGGQHATAVPLEFAVRAAGFFDCHVCVRKWDVPNSFYVYPIHLQNRLPVVAVPLLPEDAPITVDLKTVLVHCYDSGNYRRRVRYGGPVSPPLRHDQEAWVQHVLRTGGLLDAAAS
jgi:hypothetical protein